MADLEVPVLIVGGGGAGLTASMLLADLGVDSLLVSALPTTSILPKAHVLNQRTMEILNDVGVAAEIYRRGTPREHMRASAWYAGFAGHPDAGRRIGWIEAWGAGGADPDWASASPCATTNLPQIRLEPVLRERAESWRPAGSSSTTNSSASTRTMTGSQRRCGTSTPARSTRYGPAMCWPVMPGGPWALPSASRWSACGTLPERSRST